jgi:hypothetical protein
VNAIGEIEPDQTKSRHYNAIQLFTTRNSASRHHRKTTYVNSGTK